MSELGWKAVLVIEVSAISVAASTGWLSGSYSFKTHLQRYRQVQELRARNAELSREVADRKLRLEALRRGELSTKVICSLPSGRYRQVFESSNDGSRMVLLSVTESESPRK